MGSIISQPAVTVNIVAASSVVRNTEQKVLFIGQKLPAGSAIAGALTSEISNAKNAIDSLFGQGSVLAEMINSARSVNGVVQFDAIALDDDGSATDATGIFSITGTASEIGVINFVTGSRAKYEYKIGIADTDTAATVATALAAAITADLDAPVTANAAAGDVTITAKNGGTLANFLGIEAKGSVAGITVALTGMIGGATDPDVSSVLSLIGENRYQTVVWPYVGEIETIKDFMDSRFNVTDAIQDGIALIATNDSKANLDTLGNTHNSQSIIIVGDLFIDADDFKAPSVHEIDYSKISLLAGIRSLRLTDGESIAQFVIGRGGARDTFGGPAIASLPYFNTPIAALSLPDSNRGFSRAEIEDLHDAGITVIGSNRTRTQVLLGEVVTTYKTDAAGNPDVSFKYANYVDTASNIREYFFNNFKAQYAQSRLTEGDLIRGRNMANAESIVAFGVGLYNDLSGDEFVLTQAGEPALQFFKKNFTVTLDLSIGRATATMTVPIVTQFREMLATMQIAFSTNG